MENTQLIQNFYNAFASGDAETMVNLYADDIEFQDPAFGPLKGDTAKNMWRMLLKTPGIKVSASNIKADDQTGNADWVAEYTFSLTGKTVVNKVHAEFVFANGKIAKHTDTFSFWKWASQAFGFKGILLGWTSLMKNKVRQQALARLGKFESENYYHTSKNIILNKYGIVFYSKILNKIKVNICNVTNSDFYNLSFLTRFDALESNTLLGDLSDCVNSKSNVNDFYESDSIENVYTIEFRYPNIIINDIEKIPMTDVIEILREWIKFINLLYMNLIIYNLQS